MRPQIYFLISIFVDFSKVLKKLNSRVFSSLWTPDGRYLVTATQDHIVRVLRADAIDSGGHGTDIVKWRVSIGQEGWSILDLALSPDSTQERD